MRRWPVYFVLDVSESMAGEPIRQVQEGMDSIIQGLCRDPYALETAHISVIAFADKALQVLPLTDLTSFEAPKIEATGRPFLLGRALDFLCVRADREVRTPTYEVKGDWAPVAFIMSNGKAGDDPSWGIAELEKRRFYVVPCAAGPDANTDVLKRISDNVVRLEDADGDTLGCFFKGWWVDIEVTADSYRCEGAAAKDSGLAELPSPPPDEINVIV